MTNIPEHLSNFFPLYQQEWTGGDMFCGGGGATEGIVHVQIPGVNVKILWAINHDDNAIAAHAANHPETIHYKADITELDVTQLQPVDFIWMSAACTFFSKANGGKECDPQSRMLSEQIYRYAAHCKPKYIFVENVEEFKKWGPLKEDKNGKLRPDTDKNKEGSYYRQWIAVLKSMGYVNYGYRILNAADYGAYTSRKRFFAVFSLEGYPISFPSATHHRTGAAGLQKWKAVKDLLNFEDKGNTIFRYGQQVETVDYLGRKKTITLKPLAEKTLRRIYAGLQKFVAGQNSSAFISKYLGNNQQTGINNGCSIEEPSLAIATQGRFALVQTKKLAFVTQRYSRENANVSICQPCPTITTVDHNELVQVHRQENFLVKHYGGNPKSKCISTNSTAGTVTTSDHHSLVQVVYNNTCHPCMAFKTLSPDGFIAGYYSGGNNLSGFRSPCHTITTKDRHSAVFVMKDYGRGHNCNSVESPAGTITTTPKLNVVQTARFILKSDFNNAPVSVEQPCPTLTASRHHMNVVQCVKPFILPYHFGNTGSSVETASPAICANRDTYLVSAAVGNPLIVDREDDPPIMTKIKAFLREHDLADVTMRMLSVEELKQIQGFPKDYLLPGNQTQQKERIGNSVVPVVAQKLVEANLKAANEKRAGVKRADVKQPEVKQPEVEQLTLGF